MALFQPPPVQEEISKNNQHWIDWFKRVASRLGSNLKPISIIASGSPFLVKNDSLWDQDIIVQGGTVSKVEYSRDNSIYYDVGVVAGMVRLSPGDYLKITYSAAPTIIRVIR